MLWMSEACAALSSPVHPLSPRWIVAMAVSVGGGGSCGSVGLGFEGMRVMCKEMLTQA